MGFCQTPLAPIPPLPNCSRVLTQLEVSPSSRATLGFQGFYHRLKKPILLLGEIYSAFLSTSKHNVFGSLEGTRLQYWYCTHSSNGFEFLKCYFVDPEMLTPNEIKHKLALHKNYKNRQYSNNKPHQNLITCRNL